MVSVPFVRPRRAAPAVLLALLALLGVPLAFCPCGRARPAPPAAPFDPVRNGHWFIVTEANVYSSNPRHGLTRKLEEFAAKKEGPKCAAFTPNEGWTVLFGGNGVWTSWFPPSLEKALPGLWKVSDDFRWLAFTPQGGWVMLHDKNSFAADGIPAAVRAELGAVKKAGQTLRSIAFAPQGGWIIVCAEGVRSRGLPADLSKRLAEHRKKRVGIRWVAFTAPGDWFLVNDRNECFAARKDHPAYKMLQTLRARREVPRFLAFSPGEYALGYVLERQPVKRIKVVLTCNIEARAGKVDEWLFCVPRAPDLDRQRDVKATLVPAGKVVQEGSPLKRPMLFSRVKGAPKALRTTLTYEMTLFSSRLVPRRPGVAYPRVELSPGEMKRYLRASLVEDFNAKPFQRWLDRAGLRRGKGESDLTFARRAFRYIKQHVRYEYRPEGMDRRVSAVCRAGKSDCGGQSFLLVAVLRANGVPARSVVGRWALSEESPSKKGGEPAGRHHVKAEFFARGVGWVPVDMAAASGDEEQEFGFFGDDPGDFVVMHEDVELILDAIVGFPQNAWWLQGPWWFRRGGSDKKERVEEHWTVRTIPR
jgi:hypothetical protein